MCKFIFEECSVVENYFESLMQVLQVSGLMGVSVVLIFLVLNVESNNVMMLIYVIMCYGIFIDDLNKWCYYFDLVEVYLFFFWEQYINDENIVELIYIDLLLLVILFNGYMLQEYMQEICSYVL